MHEETHVINWVLTLTGRLSHIFFLFIDRCVVKTLNMIGSAPDIEVHFHNESHFFWVYVLKKHSAVHIKQTIESKTSFNPIPYFLFRKKITDSWESLPSIRQLWFYRNPSCKFNEIWGHLIGSVLNSIFLFVCLKYIYL